jgi:hypothetical protein
MIGRADRSRKRLALWAIAILVGAYAVMAQGPGWNQNAHYALIRALANGTATIDKTRFEVGPGGGDISYIDGHYYAAKSPGLAFEVLPTYLVLRAAGGAKPAADDTQQLWYLSLSGLLLPAAALLLLVYFAADRLEPGFGAASAVTLGLATMVLPFSTLFFAHVLSATLVFAAFAVLWRERRGPARLHLVWAGGLLAGLAATTEFPVALLGAILGVYAIARPRTVSRAVAYAAGAVMGGLPTLLFNQWAFGTPFKFSYAGLVNFRTAGIYGITLPNFHNAVELLFAPTGLLTLMPVVALGAVGAVLLYRRGQRAEALLIGGLTLAYFLFNAAKHDAPLGGDSPGPRYLVPILPFLALGVATAYRRLPFTTVVLAAGSTVQMVVLTLTHPTWAPYSSWFHRFTSKNFSSTALAFVGAQRLGVVLFLAAVMLAALLAALATARPEISLQEAVTGLLALVGWLFVVSLAPDLLKSDKLGNGAWAALLFAGAIVLVVVALPRVFVFGRQGYRDRVLPDPVADAPAPDA